MAPDALPGHDPANPIELRRDPESPTGWTARARSDWDLDPKPATERGWARIREHVTELNRLISFQRSLDEAAAQTQQRRAVDRTFENEVRPR